MKLATNFLQERRVLFKLRNPSSIKTSQNFYKQQTVFLYKNILLHKLKTAPVILIYEQFLLKKTPSNYSATKFKAAKAKSFSKPAKPILPAILYDQYPIVYASLRLTFTHTIFSKDLVQLLIKLDL